MLTAVNAVGGRQREDNSGQHQQQYVPYTGDTTPPTDHKSNTKPAHHEHTSSTSTFSNVSFSGDEMEDKIPFKGIVKGSKDQQSIINEISKSAETLGDPYIRGLPFPRIPLSRELQPDAGQTVSVQPIAERTPRVRLTRLLNGHTKIM